MVGNKVVSTYAPPKCIVSIHRKERKTILSKLATKQTNDDVLTRLVHMTSHAHTHDIVPLPSATCGGGDMMEFSASAARRLS